MHLRPYQQQAAESVLKEFEAGRQMTSVVMPTGCGKTVLFAIISALTEEDHGGDEWLAGVGFEAGEGIDPGSPTGTDLSGSGQGFEGHGEIPGDRNGGFAGQPSRSERPFAHRGLFDSDSDFGP